MRQDEQLLSAAAVRQAAHHALAMGRADKLRHFTIDDSKLDAVAEFRQYFSGYARTIL